MKRTLKWTDAGREKFCASAMCGKTSRCVEVRAVDGGYQGAIRSASNTYDVLLGPVLPRVEDAQGWVEMRLADFGGA